MSRATGMPKGVMSPLPATAAIKPKPFYAAAGATFRWARRTPRPSRRGSTRPCWVQSLGLTF
ncbi:hypothetical protein [Caulobacter sp. 1776]|uniref:hypothetical protein n=1 Tax=Caulobacter sp. 1776 TaxID=3156420 RepID=UPI00339AC7F7